MKTLLSTLAGVVVAATLLAPVPADAQRRAPGSDDGGSEPRSAGGRDSSGSEPQPRSEPVSRPESSPSAAPRSTPEPVSRPQAEPARRAAGAPAATGTASSAAGRRVATERPVLGTAGPRRAGSFDPRPIRVIYTPVYLSSVFGYGPWGYDRYGYGSYWGSPYSYGYYSGYGYGHPYGYGYWYPWYSSGYAEGPYEDEQAGSDLPSGSIRFRVTPSDARIYIDGALVGTVDDFDGLSNHLRLSAGSHAYELRADGYRSHVGVLNVFAGQTRTERVNLDRQ